MTTLQWSQVHAWRMSQHGLSPRFSSHDVVGAVTRTAGIQAQVASAAELALCTRVEGLFQSITEELEEVEIEGWRAFALRATVAKT